MTVSLTTLYNRLGGHFGIAKTQLDARSAIVTRATNLDGQYTAATRFMFTPILNQFLGIYNSTDATITTAVNGARKTLTEMVNADNSNIPKQVIPAMTELNRQMRAGGTTLLKNTVTIGTPTVTGTGNGKLLIHGFPSQMSRTDALQLECISDTTTGSPAGAEIFSLTGSTAYPNINDSLWPGGTGINTTITNSDYSDSSNIVVNGTFENWTGGVPDSWTITTGTGVSQLTSGVFRGTSALKLSNGSTQTQIAQDLPSVVLGPGKRVIFGFWYKKISGTPTRDITLELTDNLGTSAATLDATPNSTSWQLAYAPYQNAYSSPVTSLTATLIHDPDSGVEVAVDGLFVYAPNQYGTNGQFLQVVSGSTDWRIGDRITVSITNDYASSVLSYTERFFAPFANGIELPTTASGTPPTVTNSCIP